MGLIGALLPRQQRHQVCPSLDAMDGKYILKTQENYDGFLKAIGVPDDLAAKMLAAVPTVDVTSTPTSTTMVVTANGKTFTNTITYGQDSQSDIAGLKYTVNVNKTAAGHAGTIKLGDKSGTIEVKKTDDGYCQCITVGGVFVQENVQKMLGNSQDIPQD